MSVVSARVFNQTPSAVKAMAKDGPVYVTDRGKPSIVVLDVEEYERLIGRGSIRDSLLMDSGAEVEFEPVVSRELGQVPSL